MGLSRIDRLEVVVVLSQSTQPVLSLARRAFEVRIDATSLLPFLPALLTIQLRSTPRPCLKYTIQYSPLRTCSFATAHARSHPYVRE